MNYIFGLIIAAFAVQSHSKELPKNFKRCSRRSINFGQCLSEAIASNIRSMRRGLNELEISSIDVLNINNVSFSINNVNDGVSTEQYYTNMKMYGLATGLLNVTPKFIDRDLRLLRFDAYHDRIDVNADYVMDSNASIIRVNGNGRASIMLLQLNTESAIHCESFQRDGEEFLRATKYEIKLSAKTGNMRLTNLYRSVGANRQIIGKEYNLNSMLLGRTMEAMEEQLGSVLMEITNRIFTQISMNKLFPDN